MASCLLGLDFGTGGAKGCIIDGEGVILAFGFEEYPIIHEKPGWSEHDPSLYWKTACRIIRQCISSSKLKNSDIKGVAVSSALPSMVMVDKNHKPVERAYNLMDRRAVSEVEWLKENLGEEMIFKLTGNRLEDHPVFVNLMWEKRNRPDSFRKIHKVLTIDGFITLKLTGNPVLHSSGAPFYGIAYDIMEGTFKDEVLEKIGIDKKILPTLHRCEDIIGSVTGEAGEATGLYPGTPVAAGQVDCNAGWIGAGAVDEGDIQCNLGTVGNFGIIHKELSFIFSDTGRKMINFPYTVNSSEMYVTVPSTTTGGQSIRYIRDNFSPVERDIERRLPVSSYDLLNLQAEKIPVGSEGLVILPFLMGERTPIWDVHARGTIFGLSLNHSKGHFVRAMMEAVAYALYDSFRLINNTGLTINLPMVLNEGGAVSRLWRRIITDVFNIPTVLVRRRVGAPYGDALLAGVATGVFRDFSIAKQWFEPVEPMEPDRRNHDVYMDYFLLYKKLYEHLKDDFKELTLLRNR